MSKASIEHPVLRPFFGFFGGKWRDTPRLYPPPAYDVIVEPFAGSAGYSLRYYWKTVILCEKDPVIASVWEYLIRAKASEVLKLPDVPPDGTVDDLTVPQEAKALIGLWLNRGVARPRRKPSKWMREGVRPGSFWGDRVRQTIARQVDQIRHWQIHSTSYEVCPFAGSATWFIDPPYEVAGQHYHFGSSQIDYVALGRWCRSRKGEVFVCEHRGARWLPFQPLHNAKTTRAGQLSPEAIWTRNGSGPTS
jgi:hypothetical protein